MPFVLKKNAKNIAMKTAELVGCPEQPSSALKECLRTKNPDTFLLNYFYFYGYSFLPMATYSVVVEKEVNGGFLPDHPYKMLKEKKIADKPWIASTTTNEGIIITGSEIKQSLVKLLVYSIISINYMGMKHFMGGLFMRFTFFPSPNTCSSCIVVLLI